MFADFIKRTAAPGLARKKAAEMQAAEARKTDAIRQHEYVVARQSVLGELSSLPPTTSQECFTDGKAARRRERLELVNSEIVACPKHAEEAARLRKDMDEIENMRCAKHVYLANDPDAPPELRENPPPGFLKPTQEQLSEMGISEKLLNPVNSNFRAAVYVKDPAVWGGNPKPAYVMAFRGSTSCEEDWMNNFNQDAGLDSSYYRRAVRLGNILAANNADVHLVGHSLGGGLASAAQGGSGLTASTYNAAGLHSSAVARYSEDVRHVATEPAKITAIRVIGEALTKTQENFMGSYGVSVMANDAVGTKRDMEPSHDELYLDELKNERKVDKDTEYDTYLHGIDEVIDSTEKSKSRDESALKKCLNNRSYK